MLGLNRYLRAQRRHFAVLVLIIALAAIVVGAHSGLSDSHGDGMATETAAMCLAILGVGTAALLTARRSVLTVQPGPPLVLAPSVASPVESPVVPRARAGPPLIQVFRL